MLDRFRNAFRIWPESLHQSVENPLQADRLPDTSDAELRLPTSHLTPLQERRSARIFLAICCLLPLPLFVLQQFDLAKHLPEGWGFVHLSILVSAIAVAVIVSLSFPQLSQEDRSGLALLLAAGTWFYLSTELSSQALLIPGLVALVVAGDRMAQHGYWLIASEGGKFLVHLRELHWGRRFHPFADRLYGLELYWLSPLLMAAAFAVYHTLRREFPAETYEHHLLAYLALLGALLCLPFLVELLASFLFGRPYVGPTTQLRLFRWFLTSWLTYNWHRASGPGVLQSSVGGFELRRWLTVALVGLFAAALVPQLDFLHDPKVQAAEPTDATSPSDSAARDNGGSAVADSQTPEAEGDAPPPMSEEDEMRQKLLERMDDASRARYLQRLKERQAAREKEAQAAAALAAKAAQTEAFWQHSARVTIYPVLTMCLPVAICLAGLFAITAPLGRLAGRPRVVARHPARPADGGQGARRRPLGNAGVAATGLLRPE